MLGASARVLLDRFLEQALERDVAALCDGEDTYVAAVMQHVEEAGVHSGDSACVLPAPALSPLEQTYVEEVVRDLGAALGVVGLLNVQLAIADGELDLPADPTPTQVSVKAAVLPFARFPGADPVLGPEMRATGEVMATAADFPTAFAKAERAAGRA